MNAFRSAGKGQLRHGDLLPPDGVRKAKASPQPREIVDVEFETMAVQARRSVYPVFNDNRRTAPLVATARKVRTAQAASLMFRAMGWLIGRIEWSLRMVPAKVFAGVVTCLFLAVFTLIFARSGIASADAPLTPLTLEHVTTALNDANGMKVISVFGAIENHSLTAQSVPTVTVDVIDNGRRTASMTVAALDEPLQPGDTRPFTVRLPHAGGKIPAVRLSFDQAGAQAR